MIQSQLVVLGSMNLGGIEVELPGRTIWKR